MRCLFLLHSDGRRSRSVPAHPPPSSTSTAASPRSHPLGRQPLLHALQQRPAAQRLLHSDGSSAAWFLLLNKNGRQPRCRHLYSNGRVVSCHRAAVAAQTRHYKPLVVSCRRARRLLCRHAFSCRHRRAPATRRHRKCIIIMVRHRKDMLQLCGCACAADAATGHDVLSPEVSNDLPI